MNRGSILRSAAYAAFFAFVLTTSFACGGGGDGATGVLTATFTPDTSTPGASTVAMLPGSTSATFFNVRITVTDTDDVYGAAFDITYPSTLIAYQSADNSTSFLRDGGLGTGQLFFKVDSSTAGRLIVSATRTGALPGVDVSGTRDLIVLRFQARTGFNAQPIRFDTGKPLEVRNSLAQPIAVTWSSGAASASTN